MCGIAGVFVPGKGNAPEPAEIQAMLSRIEHRGPDGCEVMVDGCIGLGHVRLSIIDLAGGTQPIHNEDRTIWVILNGEIFNYIELRAELAAKGHVFYTRSDTEVIVHLYEEFGENFVDHLNGQFAIALWDRRKSRLTLARDRFGIRPVFFTESQGRLIFASEVKAIFALPEISRQIDPRSLAQICTFWSTLQPRSIFTGIQSLPPGHILTVDDKGSRLKKYWDWDFSDAHSLPSDPSEIIPMLRERIIEAVKLQLRSDVPIGVYVSGGMDSAIIASIIRHCTDVPLRTFSLTFEDAEFDESIWQRVVTDDLRSDHTAVRCSKRDIARNFPRTIWHAEATVVRTAPTPLMLLSRHVHEAGYKVVVSGEGADEVFGGYDIFKEAKARRFCARQPGSQFRPRILERLYPYLSNSPTKSRGFAAAFFSQGMDQVNAPWFAHIPRWTTTGRVRNFFSGDVRAALVDWDPYRDIQEALSPELSDWAPLARDQYIEAHTLMSGYLLSAQGDRVAMANSVESRVPFLDHNIVEFANRLPPHLKISGMTEKYLLRKAFEDILPPTLASRPKQPYRAPDSQSFFNQGFAEEYVGDLLNTNSLKTAGYFDADATMKLFEKCRAGRAIGFADNMAFVAILSTMLLHEQFVLGRPVGVP